MQAKGVAYFKYEGMPADYFRCGTYSASMSADACARRWQVAQDAKGQAAERFEKCRACSIGAAHAGERSVHYSPVYGLSLCPRCGQHASRLIRGAKCISCYNRECEFMRGANAKGTKPKLALYPRYLNVGVDGAVRQIRAALSLDLAELVLHAHRTIRGQLNFGAPLNVPFDFGQLEEVLP